MELEKINLLQDIVNKLEAISNSEFELERLEHSLEDKRDWWEDQSESWQESEEGEDWEVYLDEIEDQIKSVRYIFKQIQNLDEV